METPLIIHTGKKEVLNKLKGVFPPMLGSQMARLRIHHHRWGLWAREHTTTQQATTGRSVHAGALPPPLPPVPPTPAPASLQLGQCSACLHHTSHTITTALFPSHHHTAWPSCIHAKSSPMAAWATHTAQGRQVAGTVSC